MKVFGKEAEVPTSYAMAYYDKKHLSFDFFVFGICMGEEE